MAVIGVTSQDNTYDTTRGLIRHHGIYLGIVMDNQDSQRMGRLRVFIPELGGDKNQESNWYTVSYASPFAGATDIEQNASEGELVKKMAGTQKSYGFWAVPPDLNNLVVVGFLAGDTQRGIWFGCLYQQFMNHMVPGIGLNISTDDEINALNLPPVCEYNKKDPEITDYWDPKRPVYEPLHNAFVSQGLYTDPERGPSTTSARREAPSKVYGLLTPGGHSIAIDEEECNESIRLRTKNGVQILVHDSTGYIYMISREGNSWMEISDDGIDMYSKRSISMRAEESVNIHGDINVNIHSGGGYHASAANITQHSQGATNNNASQHNTSADQVTDNTEGTPSSQDPSSQGGGGTDEETGGGNGLGGTMNDPAQDTNASGSTSSPNNSDTDLPGIEYSRSITTRDKPVQESLLRDVQRSVRDVAGSDYSIYITSGGQDEIGTPGGKRLGSTRHDNGNAVDFAVLDSNGRRVTDPVVLGRIAGDFQRRTGGGVGIGMGRNGEVMHFDNRGGHWTYNGARSSHLEAYRQALRD